ncbi:MAG: NADH:ubiquinone reductase (Na(+)-transporting) subunit C [Bacteroidales bacterium]
MNRQSNSYTVIYSIVMVVVVAAVLAFTALSLKEKQTKNVEIDKKIQILNSIKVASNAKDAEALYEKYIKDSFVINAKGEKISSDSDRAAAFNVDVPAQVKGNVGDKRNERELPVYIANLEDGSVKYIFPMSGAGLWGPIWGYVSLNDDRNTVYGAYFSHKGETPGLGAEIEKDFFYEQFAGKELFKEGVFKSIAVEKKGQKSLTGADQVDAISGGTITSKGVDAMLMDCLAPYAQFLINK